MQETSLIALSLPTQKNLFLKLESENPTGSLKDRMVGRTLDLMAEEGKLTDVHTIVEASSGNTGSALAYEGGRRGYKVIICIASHISEQKKKKIRSYGAEVKEFDVTKNTEAEIEGAAQLGKEKGTFFFNQFSNPYHVQAYKKSLASEILQQLESQRVKINYLLGGVGTGASLIAVGSVLKQEHNSKLDIYAVSPQVYPTKIEGLHPGHLRGDFPIWKMRPNRFEKSRLFIEDDQALRGCEILKK